MSRVLLECVVCRHLEGKSSNQPATLDLPDFRSQDTIAFTTVWIDYAGPLLVKSEGNSRGEVWICLFSCNTSGGIHLEAVLYFLQDSLLAGSFLD